MNIAAFALQAWLAAGAVALYLLLCAVIGLPRLRQGRAAALASLTNGWLILHASQTGTAELLAQQTADALRLAGIDAAVCSMDKLPAGALAKAERMLILASTYGEGDPPDSGAPFLQQLMNEAGSLAHLHVGVLALGDDSYTNFCGFGRLLDLQLQARGAQALFARIDVNRNDAAALDAWRQQLSHLAGTSDLPDWGGPAYSDWRLMARRLLNPDSLGWAIFHLEFAPADGALPAWASGDLVQVLAPGDQQKPREYSIASIPADARVHLLVRRQCQADGRVGIASGWLTGEIVPGDLVQMRLRAHPRFRLAENAERPLILIGNGSGIAGLRGHLRERALHGQRRNWLLFGERSAAHDFHYRDEIRTWQADGLLERVDLAFSRDQAERVYVQHRLLQAGDTLKQWVEQGAAVYVCGSLKGMAGEVDAALAQLLGRAGLDALAAAGRYRRDVY